MKIRRSSLLLLIFIALVLTGCESRTDQVDSGGIILSVSDFDGLPILVSVNALLGTSDGGDGGSSATPAVINSLTIQSVIRDPTGSSSDLMNVELQSYEVVYSRIDAGNRTPPPYRRGIFGVVPAGGTINFNGLPVLGSEQLTNDPISDLVIENGGIDTETGASIITVNARITFFGKTLSDDLVQTEPINFSIEFSR